MRVLFLLNTFPPGYAGGAELSAYHTALGLMRRGVDCPTFVINNRAAEVRDECQTVDGLQVHRVALKSKRRNPWRDLFDWRVFRAVLADLRKLKPDLVHVHNVSGATLAPYLACRVAGIPVVNTLHDHWLLCPNNMLYQEGGAFCDVRRGPAGCHQCFRRYDFWADIPLRRAIFFLLSSNVRYFISPSQSLIDVHVRAGYDRARLRLVRYGIRQEDFPSRMHPLATELACGQGYYHTLIYAGGANENKGASVLLDAVPILLRYVERLRILVAGGGNEGALISRFRGLAPAVHWLGWVAPAEILSLFAIADLAIVPSVWHENLPLAAINGLSAGTPVVGSAIGGIWELIRDNETGYLFPPGDSAALAERVIHHLSRSAKERRDMRSRSLAEARAKYDIDTHVDAILQVYHEALTT